MSFKQVKFWVAVGLVLVFCCFIYVSFTRPSHDRIWELGQERMPYITWEEGGDVIINNYRDFLWQSDGSAVAEYRNVWFDYDAIETVDVFVSHFDEFEGLAHIFISFGLATGDYIAVSLETRREEGESFSPLLGILRQYEIIYVVGSERDIVGLRSHVRKERVYHYPTIATKSQAQDLFVRLASEINRVYTQPTTYNTLFHNCTNEITRQVEQVAPVKFPLTWKVILPGYFSEVLFDMDLLAARGEDQSHADYKSERRINTDGEVSDPDFSLRLRGIIKP